jgi:type IV secretory pathway VirB2 component (pilin)
MIGLFSSAAFTNSYAFATEYPEIGRKYAPLAVGLINSLGILEGGIATSLFVVTVIALGYPIAWGVLALTTVIFGPLVYLAREPFTLKEKTLIEKKDSR